MKKMTCLLTALSTFCLTGAAYAQDGGEAAGGGGGSMMQMLMMIGIAIAFFYFIVLRPERKRRKSLEQRRSSLQKGDRVTAMGIIGTVSGINEETIVLKLFDGAKMEILKAAVSDVKPGTETDRKKVEQTA